jgi:hypothetical protein
MKMCLTRIPPRRRLNGVFERRRKRDHRGRFRDGPLPYPVVGRKRSVTGLADVSEEGPDLTTTLLATFRRKIADSECAYQSLETT